ncbi:prepilin-type N-terminal cleavage/methylation domain-containing protein [Pseudalkalibacillus sp. SCS-8]|uniref:PulJ/GspJ family protein n=1 Tax=Pseudalkalibacillus nanhaiensis TaxID=3115291 RepID=UPI0032DBF1D2
MNNERGMTLIELLAALTIFSLIVGVVYSLLTFAQASWTHTEGVTKAETGVQELQTVLTRELASPVNLKVLNNGLQFESQDGFYYILSLQGKQLSLYKNEVSYATSPLYQQFSLPIDGVSVMDKNKNTLPSGSALSEKFGYLRIYYTKEGLKSKQAFTEFTLNLYDP